jgi:hypothetical protein
MKKTIKVKIALAINSDGLWHAYGFQGCERWAEIMDSFDQLDNEHRRWIVADVEVPEVEHETIIGATEPAR